MGGNGPDIALFVPEAMPVNLAMRGALADLAGMPDFDKLENRFHPSAFVSYAYNGGIYALPETQVFNMLFYRKDIFREFGLKPPETWNDFYVATAKLQKNNMQVGIPENTMVFEMLLMQNGGSIYSQDEAAVTLTTGTAINAFKDWTELYMQYSLPLAFDFFNRFRTGEMPMGITSYTFYNQLSVAAPEIRNLWGMMPVPGIKGEDGKINRSQSCNGTGSILIKNSRNTVNGYKFLDWWTSHEVQTEFGTELETVLGSSARYNTANLKAFERLPWSREEMAVIETQWKDIWDIPQTPASYYIGRNLTNAFRAVVFRNENPREVMNRYSKDMDKELKRKRSEFGLR
jgi:ABC-type glycerol-3-phosphate transport system substrate-binding protein